jgi:hypothetical protein
MDPIRSINLALSGGIFVAASTAGLVFHLFWRTSGERLFQRMAWVLWLLGLERVILIFSNVGLGPGEESRHWVYLVRLAAFLVLLWAVLAKNRSPPGART